MSEPPEQQVAAAAQALRDTIRISWDGDVARIKEENILACARAALSDAAPRQAEVASRQWQIATDIATRMVAGEPYTDNDVHQLAEAVAYLAAEERSDDGETSDQETGK